MRKNLLKQQWIDGIDPAELRLILLERIGKPGQFVENPHVFHLPLADSSCRKGAMGEIRGFLAGLRPDAPDDAKRLHPLLSEGLRDLNTRLIPANWIE